MRASSWRATPYTRCWPDRQNGASRCKKIYIYIINKNCFLYDVKQFSDEWNGIKQKKRITRINKSRHLPKRANCIDILLFSSEVVRHECSTKATPGDEFDRIELNDRWTTFAFVTGTTANWDGWSFTAFIADERNRRKQLTRNDKRKRTCKWKGEVMISNNIQTLNKRQNQEKGSQNKSLSTSNGCRSSSTFSQKQLLNWRTWPTHSRFICLILSPSYRRLPSNSLTWSNKALLSAVKNPLEIREAKEANTFTRACSRWKQWRPVDSSSNKGRRWFQKKKKNSWPSARWRTLSGVCWI